MQKSMTREKKVADKTDCLLQPRQRTVATTPFSALQRNYPEQLWLKRQTSAPTAISQQDSYAHSPWDTTSKVSKGVYLGENNHSDHKLAHSCSPNRTRQN